MKSADYRSMVKVTPTRFEDKESDCRLFIGHIAPGVWQCVVEQYGEMAQTGPHCKTKMETYSVLPDVAKQWGLN